MPDNSSQKGLRKPQTSIFLNKRDTLAWLENGMHWLFEKKTGNTVKGVRYRKVKTTFFSLKRWISIWMTCGFNKNVKLTSNQITSQRSNIDGPLSSSDLILLVFFLWVYLKERLYVNPSTTITAAFVRSCFKKTPLKGGIVSGIVEG